VKTIAKKSVKAIVCAYVFVLALILPLQAFSISDADSLIALGVQPAVAKKIVQIVNTLASPFPNNTWVTVRNAANGANINVLKVDGSDETILNADSGDSVHLQVAGTDKWVLSSSLFTASTGLAFGTSGDTIALQEATSGAKCMGSVTFNDTTAVTVATTCAATGARIFLTPTSDPTGSTAAYCWVTNIVNGTSFDVDCDQSNDGTANWLIIKEAA